MRTALPILKKSITPEIFATKGIVKKFDIEKLLIKKL